MEYQQSIVDDIQDFAMNNVLSDLENKMSCLKIEAEKKRNAHKAEIDKIERRHTVSVSAAERKKERTIICVEETANQVRSVFSSKI